MCFLFKSIKILFVLFISLFFVSVSYAEQTQKQSKYHKESFKVWGNCGMCKSKIEDAARSLQGVRSARWNMITGILKVKFNAKNVKIIDIHQLIASIGYDTEIVKASDESYNNLHYCCKYVREISN